MKKGFALLERFAVIVVPEIVTINSTFNKMEIVTKSQKKVLENKVYGIYKEEMKYIDDS